MINADDRAKGFTLIELLIVIGILGVLAAAVVVVLNPAELLAQSRDSQRLSDLGNINSALAFYAANATTVTIGATAKHSQATTATDTCQAGTPAGLASSTYRDVDGTGWVGVDFTALSGVGGSPLSVLPIDPTNNTTYYYCYDGDNTAKTWELSATLESTKYATTQDLDALDGGNHATSYEVGSEPGLDLGFS